MQSDDSRQPEIDAHRPTSDAVLARSSAALEIVRELEERLAGDPAYPTFERRHGHLATVRRRRDSDR